MSTLSSSRWIFLLSLAALMLLSGSEGSILGLPCWEACFYPRKHHIQTCFEQKPRVGCNTHGFVVTNRNGNEMCIKGHTQWIRKMIANGHLHCPPDIRGPL